VALKDFDLLPNAAAANLRLQK